MRYEEIDKHILESKSNKFEQEHGIKTIKVLTKGKYEDDLVYKVALKSDNTLTFFVCIKTNREYNNWIYLALKENQIKTLNSTLKSLYDRVDKYNKQYRSQVKKGDENK